MVRFITVFCLCITIAALGVGLPPGKTARAASITVTADFGTRVDYPLIKSKFGVYNSGYVSLARWLRDMPLIQALRPAQVRIEQQWGDEHDGWPSVITGAASNLQYNFTQLDSLIDALNNANLSPVIGYGYNPVPLQPSGGQWNNPPSPLDAWGSQVANTVAAHFRQTNRYVAEHEVWNEPDLSGVFWTGNESQYFSLFNSASRGIRAGNPDGVVSGPALCCSDWHNDFLNYVNANNLPLDVFSFHYYGDPTSGDSHPIGTRPTAPRLGSTVGLAWTTISTSIIRCMISRRTPSSSTILRRRISSTASNRSWQCPGSRT